LFDIAKLLIAFALVVLRIVILLVVAVWLILVFAFNFFLTWILGGRLGSFKLDLLVAVVVIVLQQLILEMLSRVLQINFRSANLVRTQVRSFRQTFVNPYKNDPTPMNEA